MICPSVCLSHAARSEKMYILGVETSCSMLIGNSMLEVELSSLGGHMATRSG